MTYIADIMMMVELTKPLKRAEKPSAKPLVDYLKRDLPITADVRSMVVSLLSPSGYRGLQLKLVHMRGKPFNRTITSDYVDIYRRLNELIGKTIDAELCIDLARGLDFSYEFKVTRGVVSFSIRPKSGRSDKGFWLNKGEKLSQRQAFEIAALQFRKSASSIKKKFLAVRKAETGL